MRTLDGFTYATWKDKCAPYSARIKKCAWESKNRVSGPPHRSTRHACSSRLHAIWSFTDLSWICRHHLIWAECSPLFINEFEASISQLIDQPRPLQISYQSLDSCRIRCVHGTVTISGLTNDFIVSQTVPKMENTSVLGFVPCGAEWCGLRETWHGQTLMWICLDSLKHGKRDLWLHPDWPWSVSSRLPQFCFHHTAVHFLTPILSSPFFLFWASKHFRWYVHTRASTRDRPVSGPVKSPPSRGIRNHGATFQLLLCHRHTDTHTRLWSLRQHCGFISQQTWQRGLTLQRVEGGEGSVDEIKNVR